MEKFKALVWPGYGVAILLIVMQPLDILVNLWPIRLAEVSWRFGAAGLVSQALVPPMLGLLVALAVSLVAGHRGATRSIAVFSGVVALVMVGTTLRFVLDAVQMRAQVNPQAMRAFDAASAMAIVRYGLSMMLASVLAFSAWRAAGPLGRKESRSVRPLVRSPAAAAHPPAASG